MEPCSGLAFGILYIKKLLPYFPTQVELGWEDLSFDEEFFTSPNENGWGDRSNECGGRVKKTREWGNR